MDTTQTKSGPALKEDKATKQLNYTCAICQSECAVEVNEGDTHIQQECSFCDKNTEIDVSDHLEHCYKCEQLGVEIVAVGGYDCDTGTHEAIGRCVWCRNETAEAVS